VTAARWILDSRKRSFRHDEGDIAAPELAPDGAGEWLVLTQLRLITLFEAVATKAFPRHSTGFWNDAFMRTPHRHS